MSTYHCLIELNSSSKLAFSASVDSFYSAGVASNASQQTHIGDTTQAMLVPGQEESVGAKTFAEQTWQEDPEFIQREKLVEWLGSP